MTRVTNLGLKRTYLQAGFDQAPGEDLETQFNKTDLAITTVSGQTQVPESHISTGAEGEPPKKKKRIRKKKPRTGTEIAAVKEGDCDAVVVGNNQAQRNGEGKADSAPSNKALKKKKWKEKEKEKKQRREYNLQSSYSSSSLPDLHTGLLSSEARRQKRTQQRFSDTTCFACREKGHAAKDCLNAKIAGGVDGAETKSGGKGMVGICYRCVPFYLDDYFLAAELIGLPCLVVVPPAIHFQSVEKLSISRTLFLLRPVLCAARKVTSHLLVPRTARRVSIPMAVVASYVVIRHI